MNRLREFTASQAVRFSTLLFALMFLSACAVGENKLRVQSANGIYEFQIEIADSDQERAKGLMFRTELADDKGMLFDFQREKPVSFWMRNTLIPLDMIFAKSDGTIVRIHANAKPQDPTPIPSGEPVRFVFEIAGGRAKELGLSAGDKLLHPRMGD
jgi:uncharacterized membrane protein (UPF0127 family)